MRPDQLDKFRYRNFIPDLLFGTRRMMIAVPLLDLDEHDGSAIG